MDEAEIKKILRGFLEGTITLEQFKVSLQKLIKVNFAISHGFREVKNNELQNRFQLSIEPIHLRRMLIRFLRNEICSEELFDWAALLFMAEIYVPADIQIKNSNHQPTAYFGRSFKN